MQPSIQHLTDNIHVLVGNHQRFLSFLRNRVRNPSDAEDILQAAFVKGAKGANVVPQNGNVIAWFYRVLRNAVIDHYRKQDARQRALSRLAEMVGEAKSPAPELERAVCECIGGLLPTLNEDYADLLRRIDIQGASIADAAKATGMTPNNTRVKLHRARIALRRQVKLACGTCAEHGCFDCDCRKTD